VLLSPRIGAALEDEIALLPGARDIAQGENARGLDELAAPGRFALIEHGRLLTAFDADEVQGCARGRGGTGHEQSDGLADKIEFLRGQKRFIGEDTADLVLAGDIPRGEKSVHAGRSQRSRAVEGEQPAAGDR